MNHRTDSAPLAPAIQLQHSFAMARVLFDCPLRSGELPAFRGAINLHVGEGNVLYHNHTSVDKGKFRYDYSLIQYRLWGGNGSLVFLGEAVGAASLFAPGSQVPLRLYDRELEATVRSNSSDYLTLHAGKDIYAYRIREWLALNDENYETWCSTTSLGGKIKLLEHILTGHILNFGKGIGWQLPPVEVEITDLFRVNGRRMKGVRNFLSFSLDFRVNVQLPDGVGLGRRHGMGFGGVRQLLENKERTSKNNE